jgi:branched-chain amino acid transport system permease protein
MSSPLGSLRARGIGVRGTTTVYLLLLACAITLLIGSLLSANFALQTVNGAAVGATYGSLALALVLIYRATGVINYAQGELAMLTVYIMYQLTHWGLSYWEAFPLTLVIAFVLGTAIQVTIIRPVQHRSVIGTVIVTVGLFILIDGIANWIWGGLIFAQIPSPFGFGEFDVGGVPIPHLYVGMFGVVLASALVVWALFRFTKLGLGMRAAAVRPAAASLVGVRVDGMLALGWGFAAVLGAVAGLMYEPSQVSGLNTTLMQYPLVFAFAAAVLGGLDSPAGAVVGGLLIGIFLQLLTVYVPSVAALEVPFAFAALLLVLLIKPTGLFGKRNVSRV